MDFELSRNWPVEIWATPNAIVSKVFCGFLITKVFQWVWP